MIQQVQLASRLYQPLVTGVEENGTYAFDIKPSKANLKAFAPGNTLRVLECTEEEFHPITTPKKQVLQEKRFTRIIHRPTGKEMRLVVKSLENSTSVGFLKVTLEKEA